MRGSVCFRSRKTCCSITVVRHLRWQRLPWIEGRGPVVHYSFTYFTPGKIEVFC